MSSTLRRKEKHLRVSLHTFLATGCGCCEFKLGFTVIKFLIESATVWALDPSQSGVTIVDRIESQTEYRMGPPVDSVVNSLGSWLNSMGFTRYNYGKEMRVIMVYKPTNIAAGGHHTV